MLDDSLNGVLNISVEEGAEDHIRRPASRLDASATSKDVEVKPTENPDTSDDDKSSEDAAADITGDDFLDSILHR